MMDEPFIHHMLTVDDVDLHAVEIGTGSPVVLIHGFPQHWWMWRGVMRDLAGRGHRVIAIDQRGMGGSTIAASGYDKGRLARDLAGVLDALQIAHCAVVGYDHGGGTALAFGFLFPDRATRLAVLEYAPPGYGYEYGFQPVPNWQAWQLPFFTQPDVAIQFIAGRERELLSWYFWHWAANPDAVPQEDFEVYVRQLQKPGALRGGFSHFASVFEDTKLFAAWGQSPLSMPVLGIGGQRGAGGFVGAAMQRLAAQAEAQVIDGAGHWLAEEQPLALVAALDGFLAP